MKQYCDAVDFRGIMKTVKALKRIEFNARAKIGQAWRCHRFISAFLLFYFALDDSIHPHGSTTRIHGLHLTVSGFV